MARIIQLPASGWRPRPYQESLWQYLVDGGKRAVAVWNRRSGKDAVALHWTACAAMQRPANYAFLLPLATQTRKALWTAVDPHSGKRRIHEAFPPEIIERELENSMELHLVNGSTVLFAGSDSHENLIGSSFAGIVYDEWSLSSPESWSFLRPILAENDGWALFIYTPRGMNHGYTFYQEAKNDPEWFCEKLDATQTKVFTPEVLETEKRELIRESGEEYGEALFEQEFMCSFVQVNSGAYFGREMDTMEREDRITNVAYDPSVGCFTSWDLGISDQTVILVHQICGQEVHVIDLIEGSGLGLDHYVRLLKNKPYVYSGHILPHDIQVRELSTGKSRLDTLRTLGLTNIRVVPAANVADGIQSIRSLFPKLWLDQKKTKRLAEALRVYHRSWNEKLKTYAEHPMHDWSSHYVDSLRYYAMSNVRNVTHRPIVYSDKGIV